MMKKLIKTKLLFKQASQIIPLATQTFSKSHLQYVSGQGPLFIKRGQGAYVWDVDGNKYLDMINGLLPVILGYRYKKVDDAVKKQLNNGITFSLPSPLEYELAKLLIKHISCAEMVRYAKNGGDVTTAAIRLARAVTKRDHVVVCGYHGWHDWYIGSTTRNLGVPVATQQLTHKFTYNDIDSLKKVFKQNKGKIAAVIMEPMNYVEPTKGFLAAVKKITHQNGALLIFDEIITGFRYSLGGAQKLFNVIPDLAAFGKSMANGLPISVLVGKKKYMKVASDIFFSTTFGGECLSLAAAIATIKEMEKKRVIQKIWQTGRYLLNNTNRLLKKNNLAEIIKIGGKPCWQVMLFSDTPSATGLEIKSFIQQEVLAAGILWYGQHNMSFAHTKKDMDKLLAAYSRAFAKLKKLLDERKVSQSLKGKPITNIFKIR